MARPELPSWLQLRPADAWPFLRGTLMGALWAALGAWALETYRPVAPEQVFADSLAGLIRELGPEHGPRVQRAVERLTDAATLVEQEHASLTLSDEVTARMLHGALSALDPYSGYIDERSASSLIGEEDTDHRRQIGLLVSPGDEVYRIEAVTPGGPADRAGLRPGDEVVRIAGRDVAEAGPYAINEMILAQLAGAQGARLDLGIHRPGNAAILSVTLHPEDIEPVSAFDLGVSEGVLHVYVSGFYRGVADDVAQLISRADAVAPLKGVILDLRNNTGGLTTEAKELAGLFLPRGSLLYEMSGRAIGVEKVATEVDPVFPKLGLSMVVNGASASASEIVASAIQAHGRGKIVGWQTYGKGMVQRLFPIDHGGIKITVAEYRDAMRRKIDGIGVAPDVVMDAPDPRVRPSRFDRDTARDIARKVARSRNAR